MPRQPSLFDDFVSPCDVPLSSVSPVSVFPSQRVSPGSASSAWIPLSALMPEVAAAPATARGIARLAAQSPELRQRNDVEYRELPSRTLLSRCDSQRAPFDYSINPYRGCEFGCVYCYARYTHEYMEFEDWLDFERKVFVKSQAHDALLRDLRRLDLRGKHLAIGTATDPYQPAERLFGVTRQLLEVFAGRRNLRLSITTKSDLVTRDLDLLERIAAHSDVQVNVTITTPHYELARRLEPRAPRPDKRLAAVARLAAAGIRVGVFLMPVLPRINDRWEDLDLLVRLAREHGAEYLVAQTLFLRDCSRKRVFPFLEERFPEVLPYYRRVYSRRGIRELEHYTQKLAAQIQMLKQKHGFESTPRVLRHREFPDDQLRFILD